MIDRFADVVKSFHDNGSPVKDNFILCMMLRILTMDVIITAERRG
jgi:hypothetical protein